MSLSKHFIPSTVNTRDPLICEQIDRYRTLHPASMPWERQQEIASQLDKQLWEKISQELLKRSGCTAEGPKTALQESELRRQGDAVRKATFLWTYKPHLKQWLFDASNSWTVLFIGSNQSGKTTAIIAKKLSARLGYRPWLLNTEYEGIDILSPSMLRHNGEFHSTNGIFGVKDFQNIMGEVIMPKAREMVPFDYFAHAQKTQGHVIGRWQFWNGSHEKFFSYDQPDDKLEGSTYEDAGFDEPPPFGHYIAAKRGTMAKHAPMWFTFTPLKNPWTNERLYCRSHHIKTPDDLQENGTPLIPTRKIFSLKVDLYKDQPYLSTEAKDEFRDSIPEHQRGARIRGEYSHLLGRVYTRFEAEVHQRPIKIDPQWPIGIIVDPHPRRPWMMATFAVTHRNDIVFFWEWPNEDTEGWPRGPHGPLLYHEVRDWSKGIGYYLNVIHKQVDPYQHMHVWSFLDPNMGRSPSIISGDTLQDDLSKDWFKDGSGTTDTSGVADIDPSSVIRGMDFDTDIVDDLSQGHIRVASRLEYDPKKPISLDNSPSLFFTPDCPNLVHQMDQYVWKEHRGPSADQLAPSEKPEEAYKDGPDVIRYTVMKDPQWFDVQAERDTPVQTGAWI